MMPSLRSLLSKIKNKVRGPKVKPVVLKPAITARGHFGAAFGSLERRRRLAAGKPIETAFTPAERAQWHGMPVETLQGFVYMGITIPMHSSNVAAAKYDLDKQELTVWFHGGRRNTRPAEYLYNNVNENEAIQFAQWASKGSWIWSALRVRGSKYGHRKPYRKIN